MAISVNDLTRLPALGLILRCEGSSGALASDIHWVHQSELADSSLFTEPGEVLLTTGSQLAPGAPGDTGFIQACESYVARLRASSVVGLGFGVGVHHEVTPPDLIAAAQRHGLPLFEVPYEVPFSAVVKAVSKSRSDAEHAYLRRTNSAQRRLITAAGRPDVARSVITRTADLLSGWAALADSEGEVILRSHSAPPRQAHAAALDHLASGATVSFPGLTDGHWCAHSVLGENGQVLGVVVAGSAAQLDPLAISTCLLATNLISIHLTLSRKLGTTMEALRAMLVEEALAGHGDLARRSDRLLWPHPPSDPVALVCVCGAESDRDQLSLAGLSAAWGVVADRLWIIIAAEEVDELTARVSRRPGLGLGSSEAASWAALPQARHQALSAALSSRSEDTAGSVGLLDLLPPDQALAFAHARLGPLSQTGADDLIATLATWLGAEGAFDKTAAALGLHRHTVRRRIQRIEGLLGVDLSDSHQRHELWFACQVLSRAGLVRSA